MIKLIITESLLYQGKVSMMIVEELREKSVFYSSLQKLEEDKKVPVFLDCKYNYIRHFRQDLKFGCTQTDFEYI